MLPSHEMFCLHSALRMYVSINLLPLVSRFYMLPSCYFSHYRLFREMYNMAIEVCIRRFMKENTPCSTSPTINITKPPLLLLILLKLYRTVKKIYIHIIINVILLS